MKKIIGILFYIIGALLTIGFFVRSIALVIERFGERSSSYSIGLIIALLLQIALIFACFWLGRKLTKKVVKSPIQTSNTK